LNKFENCDPVKQSSGFWGFPLCSL